MTTAAHARSLRVGHARADQERQTHHHVQHFPQELERACQARLRHAMLARPRCTLHHSSNASRSTLGVLSSTTLKPLPTSSSRLSSSRSSFLRSRVHAAATSATAGSRTASGSPSGTEANISLSSSVVLLVV